MTTNLKGSLHYELLTDDEFHSSFSNIPSINNQKNSISGNEKRENRIQSISGSVAERYAKDIFGCSHKLLISFFFLVTFLIYFDRGCLAASLDKIETQLFNSSNSKGAAINSCYLIGYCIFMNVFAYYGNKYPPLKLSGIGMFVWCIGVLMTSITSSFELIVIGRSLTGIGEAAFATFVSTIIDIVTPTSTRSSWLGLFFMSVPLGYALGNSIGGIIVDSNLSSNINYDKIVIDDKSGNDSWRLCFLIEFILGIPVAFILYYLPIQPESMLHIRDISKINFNDNNITMNDTFYLRIKRILTNKIFLITSFGYVCNIFCSGAIVIYTIQYLKEEYHISESVGGSIFGIVTLLGGIIGTTLGGYILDLIKSRHKAEYMNKITDNNIESFYLPHALTLLSILSFIAFPIGIILYLIHNIYLFSILIFLIQLISYSGIGPVNNALMWCLEFKDRPLGLAINILFIHALGDALSPFIIALLISYYKKYYSSNNGSQMSFALIISVFWYLFSAIFYILANYKVKKRNKNLEKIENI